MFTLLLKVLRKCYRYVFRPKYPRWGWPSDNEWEVTNDLIYELLTNDKPCFIGRMGTVEGQVVHNRIALASPFTQKWFIGVWKFISDADSLPCWDKGKPFRELQTNAGFFVPSNRLITEADVIHFTDIYLHYIPTMDLCGSFEYYEKFLPFSQECKKVQLESLYPFFVKKPWMRALKGKKVLVVHPFRDTILSQYEKRNLLFDNPDTLPDFDLIVIKAIQSVAGERPPFNDWFEALEYMKSEIRKVDFDVAILGCGAYGLPLAGFIKEELHKKAIHMGGGTQLLFGIKGKRWIQDYTNPCYRNMFNEYWVFPSESERPKNASKVEGACYW